MLRPYRAGLTLTLLAVLAVATEAQSHRVTMLQQQGGRVSWSHVHDRIAFDRMGADGYFDVYTMRPNGFNVRSLTVGKPGLPSKNIGQPAWHPSGAFIAFQAQDPALEGVPKELEPYLTTPGAGVQNNVWIMTADGSRFWQITNVKDRHGVLHPQFSPDGKRLVWSELIIASKDGIGSWAIKLADFAVTGGRPVVTNVKTLRPRDLQFYETHGFSPDGKKLLFSGVPREKNFYDMEIYAMDVATGVAVALTRNDEWDEHAHFTLDGRHIVWASSEGIVQSKKTADVKLDYWVMRANGTGKRRLTGFNDPSAPEYVPAGAAAADFDWGPDGMTVAALLVKEGGEKQRYNPTLRIDGLTGVNRYGGSTPGCSGPIPMVAGGFPDAGQPGFAVGCFQAPPKAPGLLLLGLRRSLVGLPLLGVTFHLDPRSPIAPLPVQSDLLGRASTAIPLPASAKGIQFFTQYFFVNTCNAPKPFSASDALSVQIR